MSEEKKEVKNKQNYCVPVDRVISNRVKKRIDAMTDEERNKTAINEQVRDFA